jgi:hypothetical protein
MVGSLYPRQGILLIPLDRLLGNPYAQPPLPVDWEVRPTYPVQTVPYYLAPLWDSGYAKQSAARKERAQQAKQSMAEGNGSIGKVPKELREKLKRSKAAKGLLQDMETEVRKFVESWDNMHKNLEADGVILPDSDDDEEVVFVGRNGQMHDMPSPRGSEELEREKLVFDSYEEDQGASFGYVLLLGDTEDYLLTCYSRWLVHSIGQYYGLRTWSVSRGNPVRREAYVGIEEFKTSRRREPARSSLPRPLWTMV